VLFCFVRYRVWIGSETMEYVRSCLAMFVIVESCLGTRRNKTRHATCTVCARASICTHTPIKHARNASAKTCVHASTHYTNVYVMYEGVYALMHVGMYAYDHMCMCVCVFTYMPMHAFLFL